MQHFDCTIREINKFRAIKNLQKIISVDDLLLYLGSNHCDREPIGPKKSR